MLLEELGRQTRFLPRGRTRRPNLKSNGKLKHPQVRSLWLQQVGADGQVKVDRVDTLLNTADSGTKFLDAARRKQLIGVLPLREHERRLWRMVATLAWIVLQRNEVPCMPSQYRLRRQLKWRRKRIIGLGWLLRGRRSSKA